MARRVLRLGITGTDTGVGKTTVARALLAMLGAEGVRAVAMKPVETGVRRGDADSDAMRLRALGDSGVALEDLCPYALSEPLAPWLAAERAGVTIELTRLDAAFAALTAGRDAIVVEGAGGVLVPIAAGLSLPDLCVRWELWTLIVAANRLGVINHTLLTVAAVRAAGAALAGIVLTPADVPAGERIAVATNANALRRLLPDVSVSEFPTVAADADAAALSSAARVAGLGALLAPLAISRPMP